MTCGETPAKAAASAFVTMPAIKSFKAASFVLLSGVIVMLLSYPRVQCDLDKGPGGVTPRGRTFLDRANQEQVRGYDNPKRVIADDRYIDEYRDHGQDQQRHRNHKTETH